MQLSIIYIELCIYTQVFFVDDTICKYWKVVLQNELKDPIDHVKGPNLGGNVVFF
jgi:hypothetical protein